MHEVCQGQVLNCRRVFLGMDVSIIITTYDWPEALEVNLRSVLGQTREPDEVIVADDGSNSNTAEVVRKVLGPSSIKWGHVWQEDKGIRQARIKNLGVRYSAGDYLIFVDHDVVMHPAFIADHLSAAEKGVFLQGKRCFLPVDYTEEVLANGFGSPPSPFLYGLENKKNAYRSPLLHRLGCRRKGFQKSLRGCNLSMHRTDFLMVDGYDETFDQLWGREDSDICYRLFHNKIKVRNLWFLALQYHLHHEVIKRNKEDSLDVELRNVLFERRKKAVRGFSSLSDEGEVISAS